MPTGSPWRGIRKNQRRVPIWLSSKPITLRAIGLLPRKS
jgi:hypothetical protein